MFRIRVLGTSLAITLVLLLNTFGMTYAGTSLVYPANSNPLNVSYPLWATIFWQTIFATPSSALPPTGTCRVEMVGGMAVLFSNAGHTPQNCKVPANTPILVTMGAVECSNLESPPFYGATATQQYSCVQQWSFPSSGLFAMLDGVPVTDKLSSFVFTSPQYVINVVADSISGLPGPTVGTSTTKGGFLVLLPLSSGTHELIVGSTLIYRNFQVHYGKDYFLTVQ